MFPVQRLITNVDKNHFIYLHALANTTRLVINFYFPLFELPFFDFYRLWVGFLCLVRCAVFCMGGDLLVYAAWCL